MTTDNRNLIRAKEAKNDEFYTQYKDVKKECQHYIEHFKDQWIYLPCAVSNPTFTNILLDTSMSMD